MDVIILISQQGNILTHSNIINTKLINKHLKKTALTIF
jgi:hypothetical protein